MASGGHHGPATAQAATSATVPKISTPSQTEKRDLTSWWKTFKRGNGREEEIKGTTSFSYTSDNKSHSGPEATSK